MTRLFCILLTLLFSLSGPSMAECGDFSHLGIAANGGIGLADEAVTLSQQQASNLARFNKKLPAGNTGTAVDTLGDGVLYTSEVPGRVPGSRAVYQKSVDAVGDTTSYLKTTFDPKGNIVHIKDKLNGGVISH
jgi:hypothetical protein